MKNALTAVLIILACATSADVLAASIDVANIATRVMSGPDDDGRVLIAVKCTIRNNENRQQDAYITLQALDRDGFELDTIILSAKLKPREARTVSQRSYMLEKDYRRVKWQVKD